MSHWRKPFVLGLTRNSDSNNHNNNTSNGNSEPFRDQLTQICEFVTENKNKTNYILDLYYQRHNYEMEELNLLESPGSQAQKVQAKLIGQDQEIAKIKTYLSKFRDEKLKNEASRFLQWIFYHTDPKSMVLYKYPSDLKTSLNKVKRYDGDLQMMSEDVNDKFKFMRA